jgi:hypothetical protein
VVSDIQLAHIGHSNEHRLTIAGVYVGCPLSVFSVVAAVVGNGRSRVFAWLAGGLSCCGLECRVPFSLDSDGKEGPGVLALQPQQGRTDHFRVNRMVYLLNQFSSSGRRLGQ